MTTMENEVALLKEAGRVGSCYFQARSAGRFDETESADLRVRTVYLLPVKEQLLQPLASKDDTFPKIRRKLALWISHNLPKGHSLLQ